MKDRAAMNALGTSTTGSQYVIAHNTPPEATYLQAGGSEPNFHFLINGTEKMRLTSGGNVGIGTASPGYTLDVQQPGSNVVRIQSNGTVGAVVPLIIEDSGNAAAGRGPTMQFNVPLSSGVANGGSIVALEESAAATTAMAFSTAVTGTLSERMRITSGGNVGIGTTNPALQLQVTKAMGGHVNGPSETGCPSSGTVAFDASLGNTQKTTLTCDSTSSTLTNAMPGQWLEFVVCQDSTGGRSFSWPTSPAFKGAMTISHTQNSAASKCDAQSFIYDGTNVYALSTGSSNM
jgi:hypothetical protein